MKATMSEHLRCGKRAAKISKTKKHGKETKSMMNKLANC